jgi:hypothetical protein
MPNDEREYREVARRWKEQKFHLPVGTKGISRPIHSFTVFLFLPPTTIAWIAASFSAG